MDSLEVSIYKRYQSIILNGRSLDSVEVSAQPRSVRLEEIMDDYDVFCFDGYGTLYNRGSFVYEGAAHWYKTLRDAGKQLRLVTNAASNEDVVLASEAAARGFDFTAAETISSGSLLKNLLKKESTFYKGEPIHQVYYIGRPTGINVLKSCGVEAVENPEQPVVAVSSNIVTEETFQHAVEILKRPESILLVLNSDAWAPNIDGTRSPVSGALSEQLRLAASSGDAFSGDEASCAPTSGATSPQTFYLGKPFPEIFQRVKDSVPAGSRILMIGDTLGTDVMGAAFAGIHSALVVGRNVPKKDLETDEMSLGLKPNWYLIP